MGLLRLALLFFVISLVAGLFGFSGIAVGSAAIAKLLFGIFLAIALILFALLMVGFGSLR